jgi:hypothetical protein
MRYNEYPRFIGEVMLKPVRTCRIQEEVSHTFLKGRAFVALPFLSPYPYYGIGSLDRFAFVYCSLPGHR